MGSGERLNGIQEVRGSIPLISTTNQQQKSVPIGHGLLLRYGDFGAGAVAGPPPPASLAHRRRRKGERLPPVVSRGRPTVPANAAETAIRGPGRQLPHGHGALHIQALERTNCCYKKMHTTKQVFCCIKRACPYGTSRVRPLKGAAWAARFPNRYDKKTGRAHFPGRFCSF